MLGNLSMLVCAKLELMPRGHAFGGFRFARFLCRCLFCLPSCASAVTQFQRDFQIGILNLEIRVKSRTNALRDSKSNWQQWRKRQTKSTEPRKSKHKPIA